MRIMKFMTFGFMLSVGISLFTGCSDDDSRSTVLLRPVTTLKASHNTVQLQWQYVEDATEYIIELYRAIDDGYEHYKIYNTDQTSYIIEGLDWDEKYKIKVKSSGHNKESAYWETSEIAVSYPTKLGEAKTIDNAAKITWQEGGNTITALKAFSEDGTEEKTFTDIDYVSGAAIIKGLTPETSYKVCAYSGAEQTVDTYEGRVMITTQPAEDYDAQYGQGKWIDLREISDPLYFNSAEFWDSLEEGTALILSGGSRFNLGERPALNKSVTFVTALTLGENAKFYIRNAFALASGSEVNSLTFKGIDFVGVIDDDYNIRPVEEETSKSFSAKQVFNENGTNSTLVTLSFINCNFASFRALVRLQADNDRVESLTFRGCTINGIGDQGAISTNNKALTFNDITLEDCTVTNVVMLGDLRVSSSELVFNITDCTFCYAPLEGTSNQLIRISKNTAKVNVSNTIWGPPASSTNGIVTNTAGTQASRMSDSKTFNPTVSNTWKTNFNMDSGCPFVNASDAGINEEAMFQDAANGNFKIKGQFGGSTSTGAIKWRN